MDPHKRFCHNERCWAYARVGEGHIVIHSRKERRYRCKRCGRTFSATKGTAPLRGSEYPGDSPTNGPIEVARSTLDRRVSHVPPVVWWRSLPRWGLETGGLVAESGRVNRCRVSSCGESRFELRVCAVLRACAALCEGCKMSRLHCPHDIPNPRTGAIFDRTRPEGASGASAERGSRLSEEAV